MVSSVIHPTNLSQLTLVNSEAQDEAFSHILKKLDKGTETVAQLRTLLTVKAAELEQLVQQLQMIDEVLTNVEYGTEQVENELKDVSYTDSAFNAQDIMKKTRCEDAMLMNKLKTKLKQLGINPIHYFHSTDESDVLQKAVIDLEIAKTISLCIKSDYKQRSTLMKNKNAQDQIQQLGDKIREEIRLWKAYTRNAPFSIQCKDLEYLLDSQDQQLSQMKKTCHRALYTRHTSSSMAKFNNSSSILKLRKLLPKKSSSWLSMTKIVVQ